MQKQGVTIMQKAHLHLIKWAVARGYSVMVCGEGEFDGVHSTYTEIKDNVEACDMGQMDLVKPNAEGWFDDFDHAKLKVYASFAYVFEYDQEPEETIYDYGVNEISEQWASDYEATRQEAA
jgi:hypothetical protein